MYNQVIEYKKTETEYIPSSSRRKKRNRHRKISSRAGMSCYILELEKIQTERTAAAAVTATIVAILATRNRLPPVEIISLTSSSRMLFPNVLLDHIKSFIFQKCVCIGCYWEVYDIERWGYSGELTLPSQYPELVWKHISQILADCRDDKFTINGQPYRSCFPRAKLQVDLTFLRYLLA